MPITRICITEHGAVADGNTNNAAAIQAAIDACAASTTTSGGGVGGGYVEVPAGRFRTGPIDLKDHVLLDLAPGAELLASENVDDYGPRREGAKMAPRGLIVADGCIGCGIVGHGVIDGRGASFTIPGAFGMGTDMDVQYTRQRDAYMRGHDLRAVAFQPGDGPLAVHPRPSDMIHFRHCRDVTLRDVLLRDSPFWTVHIHDTDSAQCTGLRIRGELAMPNADGIHVTCSRNVLITGCDIHGGDDPIAVTGFGPRDRTCRNVIVSDCVLTTRSAGVRVGYGQADVEDCLFSNLVIHGNRGLGVFVRDTGSVRNVRFENIVLHTKLTRGGWWGRGEPIHVSAITRNAAGTREADQPLGRIENVSFRGITGTCEAGTVIYSEPAGHVADIRLHEIDLHWRNSPLNDAIGGNLDLRPVLDPARAVFWHDVSGGAGLPGLLAVRVDGLQLADVHLTRDAGLPAWVTQPVTLEDCPDAIIRDTTRQW